MHCIEEKSNYSSRIVTQYVGGYYGVVKKNNKSFGMNKSMCKLANVVSGVPQGSVLGPLSFLQYTSELFSILENKLIGYDDDSTLMAVVPSPGVGVAVADSLNGP